MVASEQAAERLVDHPAAHHLAIQVQHLLHLGAGQHKIEPAARQILRQAGPIGRMRRSTPGATCRIFETKAGIMVTPGAARRAAEV